MNEAKALGYFLPRKTCQINRFIAGAERKLAAARKALSIDEEASYQLAYEAMLKASIGFMLSFGYCPPEVRFPQAISHKPLSEGEWTGPAGPRQ